MKNQSRLKWTDKVKYLNDVMQMKSVFWVNEAKLPFNEASKQAAYSKAHVDDAEARLARFAPFIAKVFPETAENNGLIESELTKIEQIKEHLETYYNTQIQGDLYLKRDDTLPIAGTIKARGAIYEVLKHAETLAIENGLLTGFEDDYTKFASDEFKQFFSDYKVVVGTTGNLGISVGVMGAKLGFEATVHMSIEAKQWKKDLLRSRGVTVIEHNTNFTEAVRNGRQQSDADPKSYFVDDEHSVELFLGYTVAANRLKRQLDDLGIIVDAEHPLFVYSPCGIGGSPGGTAFGLKQVYGDNVHCFFAQPVHMPSMLIGQITESFDEVSIADFDVDGKTGMDGLAVPRTSGFVAELMKDFFDGGYTLQEEEAYHFLAQMIDLENIRLEPAAVAGVPGAARIFSTPEGQHYIESRGLADKMNQATHIAWATGGSMVPEEDMEIFYQLGKNKA
ncbi:MULTISPECIES: D-serine ammonia-lyase [unclassified Facklamia]|uniref:D-serine ammonia-lyase n=1 Tax=Aerococcaceae TaxID=186827 RepID=UPI0013B95323|nr:D-serine ammonia-lyase [Facklamia sp. 252]NEW67258.1 D-serine ammonia-lyase [Facklamia sp. 253]QQD65142.1 D-serine ammonia-lyase [Aerococcaceae bacterium zg-252]